MRGRRIKAKHEDGRESHWEETPRASNWYRRGRRYVSGRGRRTGKEYNNLGRRGGGNSSGGHVMTNAAIGTGRWARRPNGSKRVQNQQKGRAEAQKKRAKEAGRTKPV
uniref:Uncharacterized protein n=1 Tax=Knipowitschia caucasica TaxID=637954 RepID=A0AAV2KSK6_KNICA